MRRSSLHGFTGHIGHWFCPKHPEVITAHFRRDGKQQMHCRSCAYEKFMEVRRKAKGLATHQQVQRNVLGPRWWKGRDRRRWSIWSL